MNNGNGAKPPHPDEAVKLDRRVLIVDDNQDGCTAMALLLELHGFQAECAHDAATARAMLDRPGQAPDVVLVDLRLPDLDGRELARDVRNRLPGATIALVTGMDMVDVEPASFGIDLMIPKPLELGTLLEHLRTPRPVARAPGEYPGGRSG